MEILGIEPRTMVFQTTALPTELYLLKLVGIEGLEPPIRADYQIYSLAPNLFSIIPNKKSPTCEGDLKYKL